jgi:hypothetical protein
MLSSLADFDTRACFPLITNQTNHNDEKLFSSHRAYQHGKTHWITYGAKKAVICAAVSSHLSPLPTLAMKALTQCTSAPLISQLVADIPDSSLYSYTSRS